MWERYPKGALWLAVRSVDLELGGSLSSTCFGSVQLVPATAVGVGPSRKCVVRCKGRTCGSDILPPWLT